MGCLFFLQKFFITSSKNKKKWTALWQARVPLWCCSLVAESGTAAPRGAGAGVPAHLAEILRVVLGGHKHDRLVLGPHHAAQQVEQHRGLGVLPHQEEGGLWRDAGYWGWLAGVGGRGPGPAGWGRGTGGAGSPSAAR